MEKNKICAIILLISFLYTSCVKDPQDIPGNTTENPQFTFAGVLGTQTLIMEAGVDGWTMQPTVSDGQSNIIYSTIFSEHGCLQDCNPSLEFKFYRTLPATNDDQQDFEKTIRPGIKGYVKSDIERDSFAITLNTHPGLFMSGFSSWEDLNTNSTIYETAFASTIGFEDSLKVCFQSLAYTGCQYTQCIYFDPSTLIPCITYIEPRMESPRFISLTVRPQGTPPFNYLWFNESTSPTTILQVQDSVSEIYASVRVTDALGNRSELSQKIRLQGGNVDACYFPINLISTPVFNSTPELFADKVEIIYRDENGTEWRSTSGVQDSNAFMSITGVEYFGLSPLDQSAYKVNLNFGVKLFNVDTGEEKYFASQEAVIALSHR